MPWKVDVIWELPTKAVADDGREFDNLINGQMDFFEAQRWHLRNKLNRRQCRELWQWLGRTDKVPKHLAIFVYPQGQ